MGIDGRLLHGDGVFINTRHMPEDYLKFIEQLSNKYPDLFEYNHMDKIKGQGILLWGEEPTTLFPLNYDQRPLILNNDRQLDLMKPVNGQVNLEGQEIWSPSYGDFIIRLNDYYDQEDFLRNKVLQYIMNKTYEINSDYVDRSQFPPNMLIPSSLEGVYLTPNEINSLMIILYDKRYTLVGKFLIYVAN